MWTIQTEVLVENKFQAVMRAALRKPGTTFLEVKDNVLVTAKLLSDMLQLTVEKNKQVIGTTDYPVHHLPFHLLPKWYKRMAAA